MCVCVLTDWKKVRWQRQAEKEIQERIGREENKERFALNLPIDLLGELHLLSDPSHRNVLARPRISNHSVEKFAINRWTRRASVWAGYGYYKRGSIRRWPFTFWRCKQKQGSITVKPGSWWITKVQWRARNDHGKGSLKYVAYLLHELPVINKQTRDFKGSFRCYNCSLAKKLSVKMRDGLVRSTMNTVGLFTFVLFTTIQCTEAEGRTTAQNCEASWNSLF